MKRTMQKAVWGAMVAATMATSVSAASKVEVSHEDDPITGKKSVSVIAFSEANDKSLSWYCDDKELVTMFLWNSWVPSVGRLGKNGVEVQHRFEGAEKPGTFFWRIKDLDGGKSGSLRGGNAREFTQQALGSASVWLRLEGNPVGGRNLITEKMSFDGLAEALKVLPCAAK